MKKILCSFLLFFTSIAFASPSVTQILFSTNPLDLSTFITTHSALTYLTVFFILGVGLAFTPCVLPMVPILSSIIVKEAPNKSFRLSLAYVLGMSTMYTLAGMGAALLGQSLQTLLQTPWVILGFSIVFIILALDLLEVITIKLPQGLSMNTAGGGSYIKTSLMGMLSTLIVSPCVTAPLLGVLGFIATQQQVLLGGLILFFLSLGMGLPLLLVGAGQGKFIPKSGQWLSTVKNIFGFLLLAMSIYLASRILSTQIQALLWSMWLAFIAIYILIKSHFAKKSFLFIVPLVTGSLLISMNAFSHKEIHANLRKNPFTIIHHLKDIDKSLLSAKQQRQPVFLEFYASWCSDCTDMDKKVFSKQVIRDAMSRYKTIRVDISKQSDTVQTIKKRFGVYGTPFMVFFDKSGKRHDELTAAGYISKDKMLSLLNTLS